MLKPLRDPQSVESFIDEINFQPESSQDNLPEGCGCWILCLVIGAGISFVSSLLTPSTPYDPLEEFLQQYRWKDADRETDKLMLTLGDLDKNSSMSAEEIEKFPCADLEKIERLWNNYSNGHLCLNRYGYCYTR